MKFWQPTALAQAAVIALGASFASGASAQSAADLIKEIQELKKRVAELEGKQKAADAAKPAGPASGQWGMTPEQAAEFNRIAVKTEATEDNLEMWGIKGLTITGYMDPTFIYNKRQDKAGFQFLNAVGDDGYNYDNSYFGAAVIDFTKETESGTRWKLTLAPNRGVGAVVDGVSMVHEATVSIPLTDLQTRMIVGQMPDWSGYEYLQPTLNKLITHNLLFDFTLPTAYTGVGIDYTQGKWWLRGMVANMNASRKNPGDKAPVLAYRVDYSRGEFQGFGFAGVHGKAANFRSDDVNPITTDPYDTRDTRLDLFQIDGYFIRGDWTVQGQFSYGQQKRAAITADPVTGEMRDAKWWGVSGLAAYKWTPRFETTARLDYIDNKKNGGGLLGYTFADDRNGIGPDPAGDPEKGANRTALTLGASYLYNLNTTFKVEYRLDRANLPVFLDVKDGSYGKSNHLLGTSVVVSF
ncbi:MAG: DUF3138 family protein [Piscinibacter sp.]|uniref:DUF3138 family protein n=1 Tax=Piscinibacter sp. TaxID=1903157 RepID=UPI003D0CBB2B